MKSEHGRVRTLTGYGMTLEQVAALYGVPAKDIEPIVAATSDVPESVVPDQDIGSPTDVEGAGHLGLGRNSS